MCPPVSGGTVPTMHDKNLCRPSSWSVGPYTTGPPGAKKSQLSALEPGTQRGKAFRTSKCQGVGSVPGRRAASETTGQPRTGRAPCRGAHGSPIRPPLLPTAGAHGPEPRALCFRPGQTTLGGPEGRGQVGQGRVLLFSLTQDAAAARPHTPPRKFSLVSPGKARARDAPAVCTASGKILRPRTVYREAIWINNYFLRGCLWVL